MAPVEIKNRWNGAVICSPEAELLRVAVLEAVSRKTDLRGADLRGADLSPIRDDFFSILNATPAEVAGLRAALMAGRIDGSSYEGDCACLVGTIANIRHCRYDAIPGLAPDSSRPAERFFLAIRRGRTPANSQFAKLEEDDEEGWDD